MTLRSEQRRQPATTADWSITPFKIATGDQHEAVTLRYGSAIKCNQVASAVNLRLGTGAHVITDRLALRGLFSRLHFMRAYHG